eukprot:COSAG01_NODE_46335_length_401_cov_0.433775_2_plen_63_part_01
MADVNATLRFLMACLACAGAVPWLSLTAYGMAQLPLELFRPHRLVHASGAAMVLHPLGPSPAV